jgi:hypothetical protein
MTTLGGGVAEETDGAMISRAGGVGEVAVAGSADEVPGAAFDAFVFTCAALRARSRALWAGARGVFVGVRARHEKIAIVRDAMTMATGRAVAIMR